MKSVRYLTALVMLLVFSTVFSLSAMAEGDEFLNGLDFTPEVLKGIAKVQTKSAQSPVVTAALGESHCAVLFEDGTVTAFQCESWYGGVYDYKECDTASWSGIRQIVCRGECTFGLKKDGSIIWAGKPEYRGFDSGCDEIDDGWTGISRSKGYTAIACEPYMPLFALKSDGTIDTAFGREEECASVKALTNIIDILCCTDAYGIRYLAALASDGTVYACPMWDTEPRTFECKDAEKLCVRDGALCAVQKSGEITALDFSLVTEERKATLDESMLLPEAVAGICVPSGTLLNEVYLTRLENGEVYLVEIDYTGNLEVQHFKGWESVTDACLIPIRLPTGPDSQTAIASQRLRAILGITEDGSVLTGYTLAAN